jgi:hypothetical protein
MKEVDPSTFKKLESSISNCANAEDLPSLKKAISGLSDATADLAGKTDDLFGYI